jgi:hypothetical protein
LIRAAESPNGAQGRQQGTFIHENRLWVVCSENWVSSGAKAASDHQRDKNCKQEAFHLNVSLVGRPKPQNLVLSDVKSLLVSAGGRASGIGAAPSPMTMTVLAEPMEVAPLTALRAPASINAARAAIIVFFIFTTF